MTDQVLIAQGVEFGTNDEGNARRLALYAGDELRYTRRLDRFHNWDDRRWNPATKGDMLAVARRVVGVIFEEAMTLSDVVPAGGTVSPRAVHMGHALRSQSARAINAMLDLVRGAKELWRDEDDFDTDPYLWNFRNGTLDVRTLELKEEHDREDYITKLIPHDCNFTARADRWNQLVMRTFQDAARDGETLRFVWKALGYAAVGHNIEQVIFFVIGDANTGKTKVMEVPARLLGRDYSHKSKSDLISRKRGGHHDSERYSIVGKHLVTISETSSIFNLDEASVKELTGDSTVPTRRLYAGVELNPPVTWTVVLGTNDLPNVLEWDDAIERRIIPLPAGPVVPEHERVKDLAERIIEDEAEGVLAWLAHGANAWWVDWKTAEATPNAVRSGLWPLPTSVEMERLKYAESQDHLGRFIEECVLLDAHRNPPPKPPSQTAKRDVYAAFKRWRGTGEVSNRNKLYARIKRLPGVELVRERTFVGLSLTVSFTELLSDAEKGGLT